MHGLCIFCVAVFLLAVWIHGKLKENQSELKQYKHCSLCDDVFDVEEDPDHLKNCVENKEMNISLN